MWSKLIFMKDVFKNGLRVRVNDPIPKQLFFRPCLNHPIFMESLVYDIRTLCEQVLHFSDFFELYILISNLVKLRFDQDLNKFKAWKWKTKPGTFLFTPKWTYFQSFVPFHDSKFKPFSSTLDFMRHSWRYHIPYMIFFV